MAYFNTCNKCGANLDPGEKCDCAYHQRKEEKRQPKKAGARKEKKQ